MSISWLAGLFRAARHRSGCPAVEACRIAGLWRVARAVLLLLIVVGVSPGAAQSSSATGSGVDAPVLLPGDMVRITVWRQPDMSGEYTIAADGTIAHPLYRTIQVVGVPLVVVGERVGDFLRRFEANPEFVVEALLRVGVGGEVRQPNLYSFGPETTVSQAVALAGGATERGRLDRVRLVRGGEEIFIDLTSPEAALGQMPVRSGDQITVTRRRSIFREYVLPAASITGAVAAIANVILRWY